MITTQIRFFTHRPSLTIGFVFFSLNFIFSSWIVRLPEIQHKLLLSEGRLGMALLGLAVGSLLGTPLAGWFMARTSLGKATLLSSGLACLSFVLAPLAGSVWFLFLALLWIGAMDGFMNVAMNTAATAIEKEHKVQIMSTCHGMFSLGGVLGALSSGLLAKAGLPLFLHISSVALLMILLLWSQRSKILHFPEMERSNSSGLVLPPKALIGLVVIGFFIMLGEGAQLQIGAPFILVNI